MTATGTSSAPLPALPQGLPQGLARVLARTTRPPVVVPSRPGLDGVLAVRPDAEGDGGLPGPAPASAWRPPVAPEAPVPAREAQGHVGASTTPARQGVAGRAADPAPVPGRTAVPSTATPAGGTLPLPDHGHRMPALAREGAQGSPREPATQPAPARPTSADGDLRAAAPPGPPPAVRASGPVPGTGAGGADPARDGIPARPVAERGPRSDRPGAGPPATAEDAGAAPQAPPVVIGRIEVHVDPPVAVADPFAGCRVAAAGLTARTGGGW